MSFSMLIVAISTAALSAAVAINGVSRDPAPTKGHRCAARLDTYGYLSRFHVRGSVIARSLTRTYE